MKTNMPGYLLLKTRKEKNLTQQELADKLHVSSTTISKWERGNSYPDLEKLKLLSSVLEIPLPLLLGIDSIETIESAEKTVTTEKGTVTEKTSIQDSNIFFESETAIHKIPLSEKLPKKALWEKNLIFVILSMTTTVLLLCAIMFSFRNRNTIF